MSKPANIKRRRLSDLTDEEAHAEAELLRPAREEADRRAAPLLALMWAEEEDEDINPLDLN